MDKIKRTRTERYGRDRDLISGADVLRVRMLLNMTQEQLAAELGVHRRTVIRGESRGLEIPWRNDSRRKIVREVWQQLQARAAAQREPPARVRAAWLRGKRSAK